MASATTDNPKILIGASIPRSGHHFLAGMMHAYYGKDLYYCEYYTLPSCCRSVPCTRRGAHQIIYQKSHDRDFTLPANIADALYLIQYRHPVPEALSDRELDLQETLGRPSLAYRESRAGYINWLASKAVYYSKFHDKWIAGELPNAIYLDYVDLTADPKSRLKDIVEWAGGVADDTRLEEAVAKVQPVRAGAAYKPRVIADSPYFDANLLGALEAWVIARCPRYAFPPELGGSYEESPLYGLILLKDRSEPLPKGRKNRLNAAAGLAPDHPEILRRIALRAIRAGHLIEGLEQLEKLAAAHPYYSGSYKVLFTAVDEAGASIPASMLTGDAVTACSESAELSMRLGAALGEKGDWTNAALAYAMAMALAPENPEAAERHAEAARIAP